MVLNEIFYRKEGSGRITYYNPADVELKRDDKGQRISAVLQVRRQAGRVRRHRHDVEVEETTASIRRISSKSNGADTARLFMMFREPARANAWKWSDSGAEGGSRFLRRLWALCAENEE